MKLQRMLTKVFKADLRSDTVTTPPLAMLQKMTSSSVGDDVFGEDPTVNLLEQRVAALANKEAGLFVTTGTLSNQLAIRAHLTLPPYSVICDKKAHINNYEAGGIAFHSGAHVIPVTTKNFLTAQLVSQHWDLEDDVHHAPTQLVCLENTLAGRIMPIESILEISKLAKDHNIKMHCDGARMWNASIATGLPLSTLCDPFDSVSLCFSKGMGAPVGSVLVGSKDYIKRARHLRKLFGGGWRQAGVLAGACLYSLEHIWPKMAQDHANAKTLSDGLVALGYKLWIPTETNMVWIDLEGTLLDAQVISQALECSGFKIGGGRKKTMRIVLHHQVLEEHIPDILKAFASVL